jgi:hypothetical protein
MSKPILFGIGTESLADEGLSETVVPWEDALRASTGRGSFEWWYFDTHFDDPATDPAAHGVTAVIVFATKPIVRPGDPLRPNLSVTITRPDGSRLVRFPILSAKEFSASKETCDVRIGPSRVYWTEENGRWVYKLHAEDRGVSADLTFTGLVPPWRPGAGKSYFGDKQHYFAWLPAIPFGTVEGQLSYDDHTYQVKGTGYHDHNWGNIPLAKALDHWVWGRAHIGNYTLIFVEQIATREFGSVRIPVFLLAKGEQVLAEDSRYLTMQARDFVPHPRGREYPQEVDFIWQHDDDQVRLALRGPKLLEAVSLLFVLPRWQRRLARLFANPFYFRFNADLQLSIDLGSLHETARGPALYEIMLLK